MEVVQFGDRELGELADIIRYYRKNGLWAGQGSASASAFDKAGILVKNTETNVIPAYGCMEVTGTVDESGQSYVTVKRPTSAGVLFLFNNHYEIEASGYGEAQRGPVFRCYKSTGTVTLGNRWSPTASQYYLTAGTGPYVAYGTDDIGTDVFRVVSSADTSARLYAARMTSNWSGSVPNVTATADIYEPGNTGSPLESGKTIRDPLGIFTTLGTSDGLLVIYQDGKYWAIQAPCG